MRGILAILCQQTYPSQTEINHAMSVLAPRGPDQSGILYLANAVIGHTRLAITNPKSGTQPIRDGEWVLTVNGEIYNSGSISAGGTDCDSIIPLLKTHPYEHTFNRINGQFAFAAYNKSTDTLIITRDRSGISPLYVATDSSYRKWVSSLIDVFPNGSKVRAVVPGTIEIYKSGQFFRLLNFVEKYPRLAIHFDHYLNLPTLRNALTTSVQRRLPTDVPFACLLSGGLDSTIIACIAKSLGCHLHTFCIGLDGSPDLAAAQRVANFLGSSHHSIVYTVDEGIAQIPNVIKAIETYDQTTVRASTPNYMLAKIIRRYGFKVVLSGEGADELFAGYLYNKFAPNPNELQEECVDKYERLYAFDCLRANKSCLSNSVEVRVPFLDNDVVNLALRQIHPTHKMSSDTIPEKSILREAFKNILPEFIYNRQKAQFSDAVGKEWIQSLQKHAMKMTGITNPGIAERTMYKEIFDMHFERLHAQEAVKTEDISIACSTDRAMKWHEAFLHNADPSGDAVARATTYTLKEEEV